jgi:hypothetical protein
MGVFDAKSAEVDHNIGFCVKRQKIGENRRKL